VISGLRVPVHLTSREALRMFDIADIWAARTRNHVRLVSANDHVHTRDSAHYDGLALDFHSSDPDALSALFREMGYHVLWKVRGHFGHLHVEHLAANSIVARSRRANQAVRQASAQRPRGAESAEPSQP
jgi:hypothetical protein